MLFFWLLGVEGMQINSEIKPAIYNCLRYFFFWFSRISYLMSRLFPWIQNSNIGLLISCCCIAVISIAAEGTVITHVVFFQILHSLFLNCPPSSFGIHSFCVRLHCVNRRSTIAMWRRPPIRGPNWNWSLSNAIFSISARRRSHPTE